MRFILASASPARLSLLRSAGLHPDVIVSNVDESGVVEDTAGRLCRLLAKLKAKDVAARVSDDAYILGCDSVLEFDGQILGKPESDEAAAARWKTMRGKSGLLHTGHCLIDTAKERRLIRSSATTVYFADITDAEITAYVGSGEPRSVAGGFAIDGLGAPFVDRIDGDHGTVIGVSLPLLRQMFTTWAVPMSSLWTADSQ